MGNSESLPVTPVVSSSSSSSSSPSVDMENVIIKETPAQSKPVICYATNEDFSQELSIFPDLVWKGILGYVTDTKTILALLNTSPYFHQKMKELDGLLFNAALPHVMKSGVLDFPTTLECRLVNTTIKSTIDKTFRIIRNAKKSRGHRSHYSHGPYSSTQIFELDTFMNHFRAIIPSPSRNPFVTDCVKLWVHSPEYYERAMELLTQFGHLIKEMEITFEQLHHPATLMNRLIRTLALVPNLEQLRFYFTEFPEIEVDVIDGNKKTTTDLTRLSQFPVPSALEFPTLPQLSELEFMQRYTYSDDFSPPPPPPPAINSMVEATRVMLEAYGPQLSVLKCGKEMFMVDLQPDFYSQQISNLSELTLGSLGSFGALDPFTKLSNVQLPKLTRLSLEIEGRGGAIRNSFLGLLNNLRDSLEELYVWRHEDFMPLEIYDFPRADPPHPVMLLPKLKLLIVEHPGVIMDMNGTFWTALRPRLRNLECLEFRVSHWNFRYTNSTTLPELQVRNNFFAGFPILNQFIWKVTGDDCVNSTVITRWDLQEGEQRVVSERIPYVQQWPRRRPI
ncbi:unnamed protein product [Orchesella dallaii]|uniref:F-box domain-containing protein n=1 Tax=Orchesella dallaii TaxID=48710 RepID=A0ABP1QMI5_9HEXA